MNLTTDFDLVAHPKLRPTVLPVPLAPHRFAIHLGTRQAAGNLAIDDPTGWKFAAMRLLDGSRTVGQLAAELQNAGFAVSEAECRYFIDELARACVLADVEVLTLDGLRPDEIERYSRNLNGWGGLTTDGRSPAELQRQLAKGHVLIFGIGGLGSTVAVALAMAGCGRLTIVDFDTVELSNLNRQQYTTDDIGRPKVEVLRKRIRSINPDVQVTALKQRLRGTQTAQAIIAQACPDVAVATADRPVIAVDRWINDACFEAGIPYVNTSVSFGTGMVFSKVPGSTGCFSCDELWARDTKPDHFRARGYRERHDLIPKTSAFSCTAMTIGAMIASEVIRCLVRWPMASAGRLVALDFPTLTTTVMEKPPHPQCGICGRPHARRRLSARMRSSHHRKLAGRPRRSVRLLRSRGDRAAPPVNSRQGKGTRGAANARAGK